MSVEKFYSWMSLILKVASSLLRSEHDESYNYMKSPYIIHTMRKNWCRLRKFKYFSVEKLKNKATVVFFFYEQIVLGLCLTRVICLIRFMAKSFSIRVLGDIWVSRFILCPCWKPCILLYIFVGTAAFRF